MKICLYSNTAFPCLGGQEVVVDVLARQLQKMRHEVALLSPEPPSELKARDGDFPYRIERHPRFVSTRWFVKWYELALKRLYRQFRYDVIHCHNVYPNGYLAVRHKLQGGPPVVITSHGGDVRADNPRYRKPGLFQRHQFAVQYADALVSIGPFTDQGFHELGARPGMMHSISNGVHFKHYAAPTARPASIPAQVVQNNYVLFLGRLAHRKGVDVLLKAAALNGGKGLPVVIGGDGTERAMLETLSRDLGIAERVVFMGTVNGDTKQWLLQNAQTLVIPSREWEAYPMVLLEGFASGCPVIASDAPGLFGLVKHEVDGWVVPRDNPQALADVLQYVGSHADERARVGSNGQAVARQKDWDRITEQHVDVYESVSRQHRGRLVA